MSARPKDPRLFALFSDVIKTALKYVRLAETGKTYIGTHDNWPELRWHENGIPWVTTTSFGAAKDYSTATRNALAWIMTSEEKELNFGKESSLIDLIAYAKATPRLNGYLLFDRPSDWGTTRMSVMVGEVLDRYIHLNDEKFDFEENKFLPVYLPIEAYLLQETLPATIVVPILFLKFQLSYLQISESISLQQLSDDLHLARGWRGSWGDSDNSLVESGATHGLFIANHHLENENWWDMSTAMTTPPPHILETIDGFFAAIRVSTGYATGYAQLLMLPVGWASGYTAYLIPLERLKMKSYPPSFEQGAWLDEVPTLSADDATRLKQTYEDLTQVLAGKHASRLRLAMQRLNRSAMRETDEDGVIDAMIAMEALLSDGTQEITHKVAMRTAALYKLSDPSRSEQAFEEMKKIYKFRSRIVHGDADLNKHREFERSGAKISAATGAAEHLRSVFATLLKNPVLLEPAKIDSFLLTDKL